MNWEVTLMLTKKVVINNKYGLQSKTAAVFIHKASNYKSSIWVEKGERKANAKSLLGLLSLGIKEGDTIVLMAEGEDAEEAANELEKYLVSEIEEE